MNILDKTSKDFEDYIKTYKESLNKALSTLDELEKAINYTRCCTESKVVDITEVEGMPDPYWKEYIEGKH